MSKILNALCENSIVKYEGKEVETVILSKGIGKSSGVMILDGPKSVYLTSNATDLEMTLEKIANALTKVTETLTAIGSGMTGPTTAPPGTLPASVSEINMIVSELTELKGALK